MRRPIVRSPLAPFVALALALALVAGAAEKAAADVAAGTYALDGSSARMSVKGALGTISATMPVSGGSLTVDGNGRITAATVTLNARGLKSGNSMVDNMLRGGDGLDVDRHPTVGFRARGGAIRGNRVAIEGQLTIKGTTRPARFEGTVSRASSRAFSGTLTSTINRTAFGVTAGRPFYSRNAAIRFDVRATR